MNELISSLLFIGAIPLLGFAAERFVFYVCQLSRALNVPIYGIAAGLISVLTSVPEAIVSLSAAFKGEIAMAYGNIWGSVVANSTMVIAGAALYKPVKCRVLITHKEMPLLLVVIGGWALFLLMAWPLMPLLVISPMIWLLYIKWAHEVDGAENVDTKQNSQQDWVRDLVFSAGYFLLIWLASEWLISGALMIANYFQISTWVIGLTILAIGTSLPELVVSISAQMQDIEDVTLGNVIGSNLFLILMLLPACAFIAGINIPSGMVSSVLLVLLVNLILWMFTLFFDNDKQINRFEAFILLCTFIGFLIMQL